MTILAKVYASAPTDQVLIPSIEILVPGKPPIRICVGFENQLLGVNGVYHEFEAGSISIALPKKDTTGNQRLSFGVSNINGTAQEYIDSALESGVKIPLIYREYLSTDLSAPARKPYELIITGGSLVEGEARFEASYHDLLNSAWSRERYTAETAPGIRYL